MFQSFYECITVFKKKKKKKKKKEKKKSYLPHTSYFYIVITIKKNWQYGFLWLFLAIHPYQPLLLVSSLDDTQCLALVCSRMRVHRKISLMSSSLLLQQGLACLEWFVRWEVSDRTTTVLYGTASRICSKQHAASLCSSYLVFSPSILLKSKWCNHTVVLTQLQFGRSQVMLFGFKAHQCLRVI